MPLLPGSARDDPRAMAHYWYSYDLNMVRPSEDPNSAVSELGNPAQIVAGMLSQHNISVNDFATAYPLTWSKLTQSDSELARSAPLTELNPQRSRETAAHLHLSRLMQHHFKPKDPQTMSTSKPMYMMEACAPSSSVQRRAPTAQMVPNAAVTTSPATAIPGTSTTRHIGLDSSSTTMESPQVFFPTTALSSSLPIPSILPSTPPALSQQSVPKKCTSTQTPKILLTPAPATAPTAFKNSALAALVQNTKFLSPVKQRTNGVKKQQRQQIPSSSSPAPKSVSTPESVVPEEKRRRGRPRTRLEEHPPLQEDRQYRPPILPNSPIPRTIPSNQSNSSVSTPSSDARPQQQASTLNINGDRAPTFCSEQPHLWPGRGDHVTALLYFDSKPAVIHSEPIHYCANHVAHQDSRDPHGHGVCSTCRHAARRHIRATRRELLSPAFWPLCKTCGDYELRYVNPKIEGCSCGKKWLCFECYTHETEKRSMKNEVEAEYRRRTIVELGMDGKAETVAMMGWACECGREIGPDATLLKCVGCQGMLVGKLDPGEAAAREQALTKNALAWT